MSKAKLKKINTKTDHLDMIYLNFTIESYSL